MSEKPPLPGTFRDAADGPSINQPRIEPKPEASKDLVAKYKLFQERVRPKTNTIYYPSCSLDVSPSAAFPKSRVVYVDIDTQAIKKLRTAGYEAYRASATEERSDPPIAAFSPKNVDILILLNPAIHPEIPLKTIPVGGHVLCNDYHQTASDVRENKDFQLVGMIRRKPKTGELLYDTEQLEDYWKEVDTEEEFKNAPFSFNFAIYEYAADIIEKVTGKREHVLREYKRLIALARQQMQERDPDGQFQEERKNMPFCSLEWQNERFDLVTGLPRKKGTVDDLFIFRRIRQSSQIKK